MSVLKAKRQPSPLQVLEDARLIRKEISTLIYNDFGYRKRKINPYTRDGRKKTQLMLEKEQKEIDESDLYYRWMLDKSKDHLDILIKDLVDNIIAADAFYPTTLDECDTRRRLQNAAIGNCFQIEGELQYVLETMLFDINRFTRYSDMLKKEIGLLRSWKKSDNKIRRRIETEREC